MKIEGSVALVTGANRGLGRAFAKALIDAGAKRVYAGAREPQTVTLAGVEPVKLDITSATDIASAAKTCGDVNLLINNAGLLQPSGLFDDTSADAARAQLETNFFGMLGMSTAFAPVLKRNGGGALVSILSVLSWINLPTTSGYAASKAAAWALTNAIRNELRAQGTLVIGVHAAFIDTDMTRGINAPKISPAEVVEQTLAAIEGGAEEVLADEVTRSVKRGLSADPAVYLRPSAR